MNHKLNITLLYVEDEEQTRERLTEVFEHKVKKLYVAKDGEEALELFKKHHIHLIISDYRMPKMNGNELCMNVKELNPLVSFILLTAFNDSTLLIEAIDSGVDKFLQKPVNAKKLFNVLDEINKRVTDKFELEKSMVCLQEAEKIALLSYWSVNLHSKQINFSKEAKELFHISDTDFKDYKTFASKVKNTDKIRFLDIFERRVFEDEKIDEVVIINNQNSKDTYIHIITKRWTSSACGTNHVIGLFQDVTHFEVEKIRLLKENQLDPVLKIANKKYLANELNILINSSKRYGHNIGVLFFDIDDFKDINERYGHLKADDVLIELSNMISSRIRQSDIFGRWGGDEFVILASQSSPTSTMNLGDKIIKMINNHNWVHDIDVTISMGISFYEFNDDVQSLLDRADMKMLEAKKCGKNKYIH